MSLEELTRNDWIRAAILAQMVLSQGLPDERLDELVATPPEDTVRMSRAA